MIIKLPKITIVILLLPLLASSVQGAVYYLDCELGNNNNPGTIDLPWKSFNRPNINMVAGDTLYVKGGTNAASILAKTCYVEDSAQTNIAGSLSHPQGIKPENSGTDVNHRITYSNYPGETVHVVGTHNRSHAVYITKSYIHVTGINFSNMYKFMWIDGGSYNEVDHCTFDQVRYYGLDGISVDWRGSTIYHNATQNWVHDNVFSNYGSYSSTNDLGVLFELGIGTASTDASDHNTIENNIMYHGGHHVLGVNTGRYNVIRNINMHNEPWYASAECSALYADTPENPCGCPEENPDCCSTHKCGYRVVSMTGTPAYSGYNLLENLKIAYGGPNLNTGAGGSGLSLGISHNLVRYNDMYANNLYGARFGASISQESSYNYLYSNTFYHNGYGPEADLGTLLAYRTGLYFYGTSCDTIHSNVVKNNLFHAQWSRYHTSYPVIYGGIKSCSTVENNCEECTDDPLFLNPDISNPMSTTLPDLGLSAGSPLINKGTYLTQASGSGASSKTLIVADAGYFQDAIWGSDLARGVTLFPDWIAIGTVTNAVQISSINYDTNTITLASPMTWSNGAPIWLYRKSDGARVLYGSAPDYGAYEYGAAPPATCPDGTPYSQCSTTKPLYCSSGTLTNNCQTCGCPTGQSCQADGSCQSSSQYLLPDQYIEAESGILVSPMQAGSNSSASGGQYIYTSTSYQGSASYTFQIGAPGRYRMEARILTPLPDMAGADSFYLGLDGEPAQGNDNYTYDTLQTASFAWDNVSMRGPNGNITWSQYDPMVWDLTAGLHTFTFYGREANTWLDQIILRKACAHKSDNNPCNGCISNTELFTFIDLWKVDSSNPTLKELIEAIGLWKRGC
ncbi:MAG TPA: hypothetical protein VJ485_04320 [archaeon]|nr:hypothetical protein [archaeon]